MAREFDIDVKSDYRKQMASQIANLQDAGAGYNRAVGSASHSMSIIEEGMSTSINSTQIGVLTLIGGIDEMIGLSEETIKAIGLATIGINVATSLIDIYEVWAAVKAANAAAQWSVAGAETTAAAIAQQWHAIAFAVAALGVFGAAFYGGKAVGAPPAATSRPSTVDGGDIDLSDPTSRRRITRVIRLSDPVGTFRTSTGDIQGAV